ncbi:MAG: DUF1223 domain-containing protein [Pseudomonadota bacterium]
MKRIFAILLLLVGLGVPARADDVVIELFASANCPSCPKAHKLMSEISETRDDVLVLTWAVDYWDYLGEPDPRASQDATARQRAYVDRFRVRAPYTPQTVYNGVKQCPGVSPRRVRRNIKDVAKEDMLPVEIERTGDRWRVQGDTQGRTLDIFLLELESAGYDEIGIVNAITAVRALAPFAGGVADINATCDGTCALVVQEANFGPIVAAARL